MATVDEFKRRNYYQRLGLPRTATVAEVKEAYREIARVYHPDSHFFEDLIEYQLTEDDIAVFQMVTAAYDTLIREEKRSAYDRSLPPDKGEESCEAPKPTVVKGTKEWDAPSDGADPPKKEVKAKVRSATAETRMNEARRAEARNGLKDLDAARDEFKNAREQIKKQREDAANYKALHAKLVKGVVVTIWVGLASLIFYLI